MVGLHRKFKMIATWLCDSFKAHQIRFSAGVSPAQTPLGELTALPQIH